MHAASAPCFHACGRAYWVAGAAHSRAFHASPRPRQLGQGDAAKLMCPRGQPCCGSQPLPAGVLWLVVHAPGMMFGPHRDCTQQEHHACMRIPTTTGCMRISGSTRAACALSRRPHSPLHPTSTRNSKVVVASLPYAKNRTCSSHRHRFQSITSLAHCTQSTTHLRLSNAGSLTCTLSCMHRCMSLKRLSRVYTLPHASLHVTKQGATAGVGGSRTRRRAAVASFLMWHMHVAHVHVAHATHVAAHT